MADLTYNIQNKDLMGDIAVQIDFTLVNYKLGSSSANVLVRALDSNGNVLKEKTVLINNLNSWATAGTTLADNITNQLGLTKI